MKTCKVCGEEKDDWDFTATINKKSGQQYVANTCRACQYAKRRERNSGYQLECKYGITKAQWELMLKSQDNKCKLCGKEFDGDICVDHDHKTMVVRGLLCTKCNTGLGKFDDNPRLLEKAILYLETANALKELA